MVSKGAHIATYALCAALLAGRITWVLVAGGDLLWTDALDVPPSPPFLTDNRTARPAGRLCRVVYGASGVPHCDYRQAATLSNPRSPPPALPAPPPAPVSHAPTVAAQPVLPLAETLSANQAPRPLRRREQFPEWVPDPANSLDETEAVQRWLWQRQHPASCDSAKVYVWNLVNCGLGAELHQPDVPMPRTSQLGFAMASAISMGRILVVDDRNWVFAPCHQGMVPYFLPPSNCSFDLVWAAAPRLPEQAKVDVLASPQGPSRMNHQFWLSAYGQHNTFNKAGWKAHARKGTLEVPKRWKSPGHNLRWWWAQCTRYLLRFTDSFLQELQTYRAEVLPSPNPLPGGTLGIHVRASDKVMERVVSTMGQLQPYVDLADEAVSSSGSGLHRKMFIATESDQEKATKPPRTAEYQAVRKALATCGWKGDMIPSST
eukprot:gene6448-1151_t